MSAGARPDASRRRDLVGPGAPVGAGRLIAGRGRGLFATTPLLSTRLPSVVGPLPREQHTVMVAG